MKVAFLVGRDGASTRHSVEAVCRVAGIEPVGLLLDTSRPSFSRRVRDLLGNLRSGSPADAIHGIAESVADWLDRRVTRFVPNSVALELLRTAFPDRAHCLEDLARRYGFRVHPVVGVGSDAAIETLRRSGAELGIVLGMGNLPSPTSSLPRLGCLRLHKGAVPDDLGLPAGFWELFDGSSSVAVSVHIVENGSDRGVVVGTREIPIHPRESEDSLRMKLDHEGAALLANCVADLSQGSVVRNRQNGPGPGPRAGPTRLQRQELLRRRPYLPAPPSPTRRIVKTLFHGLVFYAGVYHGVRLFRRMTARSRAAILLYHRVNDLSVDVLTTSTQHFAEQLALLGRRYTVRGTSWLVDRLERNERIPPDTIIVHFDDCYRDVRSEAAPLLRAAGMPATAFIASGFLGTSRRFDHDLEKSPFIHENLAPAEVRELSEMGITIGAHTVNHVNLGQTPLDEVHSEVVQSRADLEAILQAPVDLFSFPYGRISDISEDARSVIVEARFRALFSAYGGIVTGRTSLFDIPRMGSSSEHRCLDLMMEIEGISIGDWLRRLSGGPAAPTP